MALRPASRRLRAAALQLSCLWLLSLAAEFASAQDSNNAQGALLYSMGKWLTNDDTEKLAALGWVNGGNPCSGWAGVTCNPQGYVSTIALPNQGLDGSLPPESSIWGGLTGLTSVDLSSNSLGGSVPNQLSAAGPQLTSINLAGNGNICGTDTAPAGVTVNTAGTKVGTDCSAVTPATGTPSASPAVPAASPLVTPASPAANATNSSTAPAPGASPAPEAPATPAGPADTPVELPASPAAPAPAPVPISDAPVCSCALKGFSSDECASALKGVCGGASAPALCTAGANGSLVDPSTDETAAQQLGQYLADACFPNQDKNTNICTCVQNLLSTDCAKARVSLCVTQDPLCLPFQNIIDVNGSSSADAVSKVAPVLNDKCPVSDPTVPGVKATMQFPSLSMGQYITKQYTQNVANALSAVTNVPSSSISTLDVRPFLGQASTQGRRRALLQSAGNGVQATYFLTTDDPRNVSQLLSTAAENGQLSKQLGQYGITSPAGSLKVQSVLPPTANSGGSSSTSGGTPAWIAAPIILGILALGALAAGLYFCKFRRNRKAKEYAPGDKQSDQALPVAKSYDYTPAPVTGYPAAADTAGKAARPATPEELPVSRSLKVNAADQEDAANWAADTTAADGPSNLSPLKTTAVAAAAAGAAGTAAAAWKSNVRPASGQVPSGGSATTSSMAGAKNAQQAERAKFWAQFQETWQQVRQNQNINDEPGTPSSGTNWTDVTGQHSPKKHSGTGEPGQ